MLILRRPFLRLTAFRAILYTVNRQTRSGNLRLQQKQGFLQRFPQTLKSQSSALAQRSFYPGL